MPENLKTLLANLSALGPRRLLLLGGVFLLVLLAVGVGSIFLNRPAYQPLYVGLERDDVTRMKSWGVRALPYGHSNSASTGDLIGGQQI